MDLNQYTPNAICHAMGLGPFIDPAWGQNPTIRLLLKPSFHPECCITAIRTEDATELSVVCLGEMVWRLAELRILPSFRSQTTHPVEFFATIAGTFQVAYKESLAPRRTLCVDGMGIDGVHATGERTLSFATNAFVPGAKHLGSLLIDSAWRAAMDATVKNALAHCGMYADLKLPQLSLPHTTRIAILGSPDDRQELLGALNKQGKAQ